MTHPQATHHVERRVGGWYDSELTNKGKADAAACGKRFLDLGLEGVPIFSSDLTRTRQTAHAIATCLGSDIRYDARLREMSFGEAEGRAQEDVGGPILSSDKDNRLDFRNAYAGETKRELASRLYEVMAEISQQTRAIICTHGYAATFLIAYWIGMPLESVGYVNFRLSPGSITSLVEDDVHANRAIQSLNDTRHLQASRGEANPPGGSDLIDLSMHSILVFVPDLNIAREFYESTLGLRLERTGSGFHVFGGGNFQLVVFLGEDVLASGEYSQAAGSSVAFAVPDLDLAVAKLSASGVRFLHTQPRTGPIGRYVAFLNPFGTVHELIEVRD